MMPGRELLRPGPWRADGSAVYDGTGRLVCICYGERPALHAAWLAELQGFIGGVDAAEAGRLRDEMHCAQVKLEDESDRNEELGRKVEDLEEDLDEARSDARALDATLASIRAERDALKERLGVLVQEARAEMDSAGTSARHTTFVQRVADLAGVDR